jgi:DNA-binding beta-propeller fold protein YncE
MLAEKLRAATAAAPEGPWDLAYAYYDPPSNLAGNLSTTLYIWLRDVESQEPVPTGIFLKPDLSAMYIVGLSNDAVNQYSLSIPGVLTSATFVQAFSVGGQEVNPEDIFFKPDGTKMYIVGSTGDDVNEYNLSTAWDVSTASYLQNFSVAGQDTSPTGIFFKPDGTKMYILGDLGNDVNEYDLSTAWDVSTASFLQNFSVAAETSIPQGISFNPDGTKMYVVGPNEVNEYSLSTAWDVSTASFVRVYSVDFTALEGIFIDAQGGSMWLTGSYNDGVTSFDLVRQYVLGGFDVGGQDTSPQGLFFKPDGTKMYITGITGDEVYQYNLSTAWDIGTATFVHSFSVAAQESAPEGLFFKPDGTKMYIIGSGGDDVNEYNLSTAWDVSTASYLQNFSVAAQETSPQGLFFKPDGLKMYITGITGDDVNEYNLSTAWDVSTASYLQNFSVAAQETDPQGLFFKPDGLKMYVCGNSGDDVNEYNLSTAWDISTASFLQNFSVRGQNSFPTGLFFKPDGTKMYIVGPTQDRVYQYTLGIQE